ncbi:MULTISPECIES: hypothetical protein [Luteibacter]|uniref:hypothetical protein n=1 Tax=Luteibacter TaxID=242605 RepID=UPI00055EB00E|nr:MULTISPECIES: hypothetical protein [unclassified Luteibacter]
MLTLRDGLLRGLLGRFLPVLAALGIFAVPGVAAAQRAHYLIVYNDDALTTLRVEIAPHGSGDFRQLDMSGSLAGGQSAHTTATYPDDLCSVDLRVTYAAPSPVLTITDWDLCRSPKIHLGMARRAALASPAA